MFKPSYLGAPCPTAQMFAEWLASAFVPWPLQWTPSMDVKSLVVLGSRQWVVQIKGLMLEVMFEIRPAMGSFEIKSWDTGYFPRPKHKHLARNTPLHREMCKFTTWHDSWFYILSSSSLSPANSSGGWGRRFFGKFGSSLAVGGVESELNMRKTAWKSTWTSDTRCWRHQDLPPLQPPLREKLLYFGKKMERWDHAGWGRFVLNTWVFYLPERQVNKRC